jgi:ribosome-binding ATPase YchF (GTP1/OBG family)
VTDKDRATTIEFVDIPGLARGSNKGEGVGNRFLADIRNTDALIHVLRCFDNDNLPHIDGSVDPVRDMDTVDFELQVKDMESVEKKLQRLEKLVRSGDRKPCTDVKFLRESRNNIEISLMPVR